MRDERTVGQWRLWYARLLRLYPKPYQERFGEGMAQTFHDVLRERAHEGVRTAALWMLADTCTGIAREHMRSAMSHNKNVVRLAMATGVLLLIPLVAMQFTQEVAWTLSDFVVAGTLLFGAGLTYDLVARRGGGLAYRAAVGLAVGTALLLVWVNLAVGVIGSEGNAANLMFVGVLAVGSSGALVARFEPDGMTRALLLTALAQMVVATIAFASGWGVEQLVLNGGFAALWIGSAILFRRACVMVPQRG